MNSGELKEFLDEKYHLYNNLSFIETDPIQIPKKFSRKEDIEIAGFLAATIAWGQRGTIIRNAEKLLGKMGYSPFEFLMGSEVNDFSVFDSFVHRTFNGTDCRYFLKALKIIYEKYGGLEGLFTAGYEEGGNICSAITLFRKVFLSFSPEDRTTRHVANPVKGSAAKRINMFLRWMIRKDKSEVDFGIWDTIPQSALMIPLDVHSGNVARNLGLLKRKQNDWKAVEELTGVLREFDSTDPVKYDFALFGLGAFGDWKKVSN